MMRLRANEHTDVLVIFEVGNDWDENAGSA
jgi:hypothetical protein